MIFILLLPCLKVNLCACKNGAFTHYAADGQQLWNAAWKSQLCVPVAEGEKLRKTLELDIGLKAWVEACVLFRVKA